MLRLLLTLSFAAIFCGANAQGKSSANCGDAEIQRQTLEIQQHYQSQGFELVRETMQGMASITPYSIVSQMPGPALYMIVFIGNPTAKRIKLDVFDGGDMPIQTLLTLQDQPNYVLYTLPVQRNSSFRFELYQRMPKHNGTCSSFFIMRLNKREVLDIKPYDKPRPLIVP